MLVLRRKTNESIVLNNVIKITVLSVEGDRVKIGIEAPPDVIVVREELLDEHRMGVNHGSRGASPDEDHARPQSTSGYGSSDY